MVLGTDATAKYLDAGLGRRARKRDGVPLRVFDVEVPNSSAVYNYYEWNAKYRPSAASNVNGDTRPLPAPTTQLDISNPLVLMTTVGGLIQFSAQTHDHELTGCAGPGSER